MSLPQGISVPKYSPACLCQSDRQGMKCSRPACSSPGTINRGKFPGIGFHDSHKYAACQQLARHGKVALQDVSPSNNGAGERNRTPDRLITNQLLYRLSYASICSGRLCILLN
jgi:hypothetical protein